MPQGILLDRAGKNIGETDLPEIAFGIEPNEAVVHQYVEVYRANQQQGTHSTKDRSEVRGGGRKPWRQKGTGRARVGTIRSPLWRHGGVTFGPSPRSHRKSLPQKMRRLALASVLSDRSREGSVFVFEDIDAEVQRTAELRRILTETGALPGKVLLITNSPEKMLVRSGRNIPGVEVTFTGELNAYQVLAAEKIMITRGALPKIEELCGR